MEFPIDAYNTLVRDIHAPVFFSKLANDYNIHPRSKEEYDSFLELAGILQNTEAQNQVKRASAEESPIVQLVDQLKQSLGQNGYDTGIPTSHDKLVKQAAFDLAKNNELAEAALAFGSYLASQGK
jgi:hypothetical protein